MGTRWGAGVPLPTIRQANVNIVDRWGHTALDDATGAGFVEVRDALIAAGASFGRDLQATGAVWVSAGELDSFGGPGHMRSWSGCVRGVCFPGRLADRGGRACGGGPPLREREGPPRQSSRPRILPRPWCSITSWSRGGGLPWRQSEWSVMCECSSDRAVLSLYESPRTRAYCMMLS